MWCIMQSKSEHWAVDEEEKDLPCARTKGWHFPEHALSSSRYLYLAGKPCVRRQIPWTPQDGPWLLCCFGVSACFFVCYFHLSSGKAQLSGFQRSHSRPWIKFTSLGFL